MPEAFATWVVQAVFGAVLGIIAWSARRLVRDLEQRIAGAETHAQKAIESLREEFVRQSLETRREGDLHVRRCELIQHRLAATEQRSAADQAILGSVGQQLAALAERVDAIYRLLTERGR